MNTTTYTPVILIGAARSGTKLLRDVIGSHEAIEKIPFDINFVWKYSNEGIPHDLLTEKNFNKKANKFIKRYLKKHVKNKPYLIEKTVSNSVRLNFIKKVFPDAKYIYLIRDGRDVVESVVRQWGVTPDKNYLMKKIMLFPLLKSIEYAFSYGVDLIKIKFFGSMPKSYVWGVKYPGYELDLEENDLAKFCAKQWRFCVEQSEKDIQNIPSKNVLRIQYEKFVDNPSEQIKRIEGFLNLETPINQDITKIIRPTKNSTGFKNLSANDQAKVLEIIKPTLIKLNYLCSKN